VDVELVAAYTENAENINITATNTAESFVDNFCVFFFIS
jgi:hypothetical protein